MEQQLMERAVLGTMLADVTLLKASGVEERFFLSAVHQTLFRAMNRLSDAGRPVDGVTLLMVEEPQALGGANYVMDLVQWANHERFFSYVELLMEAWREREKRALLQVATSEDWAIVEVQRQLDSLLMQETNDLSVLDLTAWHDFAERDRCGEGVPTGMLALDQVLGGFMPSELTIVAARPSMGKTDFMNNCVLAAGRANYLPIMFSLEMTKERQVERLAALIGNINRLKMKSPRELFSVGQKEAWISTLNKLKAAQIVIEDRAHLTVAQIRARAYKVIRMYPERRPIIFIDYLQIIAGRVEYGLSQNQVIAEISWGLKQMAKDFACPVVCLSQLNRAVEGRSEKRPMLSDLRDSGNIEQDADVVAFLYRKGYYTRNDHDKSLEVIVAKHRNGPVGSALLQYHKGTGKVVDSL